MTIRCPNCQFDNRDGATFCSYCGTQLGGTPSGWIALQPGQTMKGGAYRIVRPLGKGGMGALYLAEDVGAFNRLCVIKEMLDYFDPRKPQEAAKAKRRFEDEARVLATLQHSGIPDIYTFFSEQGRNYIVMQFVDGENLEQRLAREGQQKLEDVARWGVQVCRVLEYLGRAQPNPVVHHDIKPANLILDKNSDEVRLVDFGTAKARLTLQPGGKVGLQKSSIYGTVGYAPPEQHQARSEPRSDVYALAATMYHLLTGDDPRQHRFNFPQLSGLPAEIRDLLLRSLEQDVRQRLTATQMRQELEAILVPVGVKEPFHSPLGHVARDETGLVALCDQDWEDGKFHFYRGDFEERLRHWSRADLEVQAATLRRRYEQGDQDAGLDAFVRLLDPNFPQPVLQVGTGRLDFGNVGRGGQWTADVPVTNAGRGYMQVAVSSNVPWVQLTETHLGRLAGEQQALRVEIDTTDLPTGQQHTAQVTLDAGSGGRTVIPVTVTVPHGLLGVDRNQLDFGSVYRGQRVAVQSFVVSDTGGSYFDAKVSGKERWIEQVTPDSFRCQPGQRQQVEVAVDTQRLPMGQQEHVATLNVITSDAGAAQVWITAETTVVKELLRWFALTAPGRLALAAILLVLAFLSGWAYLAYHYASGLDRLEAGRWAEARAEFERVIILGMSYRNTEEFVKESYYRLGLAYLEAGEWEKAQAELKQVIGYKDADELVKESHYRLGLAYFEAGEWEQARAELEQVMAYEDAEELVKESYYRSGIAYLEARDLERAEEALRQVLRLDSEYKDAGLKLLDALGHEMAYVPAGEFLMGSKDDRFADDDEHPQHTVYVSEFWIDKTEVANTQYRKCVESGVCRAPTTCDGGEPTYSDSSKADHPVVCVSWWDAKTYCEWAGKRLPTEAEWEKAARGTDGRKYPWGNSLDGSKLNSSRTDDGYECTAPVGSYPEGASPYGALDMAGNVWEWCQDWYDEDYYVSSPQHDPQGPDSGTRRVVRGGSWTNYDYDACAASRHWVNPDFRGYYYGFRCVSQSP
jgi:formylglycine-generating enzyme required for sulfatase activity/tRNA A-37 threonylcarbamoyl transferase component Bud32